MAAEDTGNHSKELVHLVFVGSPLLDITTHCGPETLDTYDLKPDDCVRADKRHDRLFDQLFGHPGSRLDAGGSALNSAKIAKWVLGERGDVSFAGCVGRDRYSSELRKDLQSSGVHPLLDEVPGQQTGVCACLLSSDGKRSMVTRHGAAALFDTDQLTTEAVRQRLEEADCIFVVGYFVVHSPEVVRALADMCSPSQLFSLSLSAEYVCKDYTSTLLDVLPRVDILVGNEAEIMALAEASGLEGGFTIEKAVSAIVQIQSFNALRPRIVIISRGPDPVIFVRAGEPPRHFTVPQDVLVVDSVGCGDALAGAFLGVYALTDDEERAVVAGIQAAVKIAQVNGCDPPHEKLCF